ncbi:ABC-type cobalamin transport system ATPase subunit [Pseudacidovorax sp. 1753]|uniref:AAA family ATPase n=1 Tax=Pseudacidovorax sp. 1753 TaxID=3156419 RepID=UPI003395E269
MDFTFTHYSHGLVSLVNCSPVNLILGRNGAGKSTLLRTVDEFMNAQSAIYRVTYVTPERSGSFVRDGNIDTNMGSANWGSSVRRSNQAGGTSFKAMSHYALRNAETAYLRKLQNIDARGMSFQTNCLNPISNLLSNISIEQGGSDFIFKNLKDERVDAINLSSGESETVSLAAEVLYFFSSATSDVTNVLLLDEPDVHQHPDLQARFGQYLLDRLSELPNAVKEKTYVFVATHSNALVCALAVDDRTSIGNKEFDSSSITFASASDEVKKVAPFFGHPLSLSLNRDAMLIVEGEDDERVWQQAARSSQGKIRIFPVLAQSVNQQHDLESFCDKMLRSIYDKPVAYSLRDADGRLGDIEPVGCVQRFKLNCYAIENMLLTSECLQRLNTDWAGFVSAAHHWLTENIGHKDTTLLQELINSADRMQQKKIKNVRQLIVGILGSNKPWEAVVGQAMAAQIGKAEIPKDQFSLLNFLGRPAANILLGCYQESPA